MTLTSRGIKQMRKIFNGLIVVFLLTGCAMQPRYQFPTESQLEKMYPSSVTINGKTVCKGMSVDKMIETWGPPDSSGSVYQGEDTVYYKSYIVRSRDGIVSNFENLAEFPKHKK